MATMTGVKDKYLSSSIFILDLQEHIDFVWVKPTLTKSRANNICGGKERKQKQKESFSSSHNELLCLKSFSWKSKGREATLGCGDKLDRFFWVQILSSSKLGDKEAAFSDDKLLRECFHGGGSWNERIHLGKRKLVGFICKLSGSHQQNKEEEKSADPETWRKKLSPSLRWEIQNKKIYEFICILPTITTKTTTPTRGPSSSPYQNMMHNNGFMRQYQAAI